ncbi:sensor histidine kinase [Clostridium sp. MB05]|jgi:two-component system, sensor histidine kinase YesM|uniref:sensor histidine kinase n=1 Tax=Clostridium sp. MB05 TaxID=3376682 RepID=UPI003982CE75
MFTNKNMSKKFIVSFMLFIIIPVIVITLIFNRLYVNILIYNYNEKVQQIMEQLSIDFKNEFKRMSLSVAKVSTDEELLGLVNNAYYEEDAVKKLELSRQINSKLDYLFAYLGEVNSITFLSKDGREVKYKEPFYKGKSSIKNNLLYKQCIDNKDKVVYLNDFRPESINTVEFLFGISPSINYSNTSTDLICFEMKNDVLKSICSKFSSTQIGEMIIADSNGKIVIAPYKELIGENVKDIDYINLAIENKLDYYKYRSKNGIKYITTYSANELDWKIINIIDYNNLTKDTSNAMNTLLLIFFIIILLYLIYCKIFFTEIINPIKSLMKKMDNVQNGKLDEINNIESNIYEIKELNINYNKMINNIKELMIERDLKEKERSKQEIKVLQAQINPHFIYNTLNVIKLMATISKIDNIRSVTDSFMKLLALTFKSDSSFITIREELQYITSYSEIMRVRFGDNFNLIMDFDEGLQDLYIIKLVLQPIVENSIVHGLNELEGSKDIIIKGYLKEDKLIIEVIDNGVGMYEEDITKVFENHNKSKTSLNGIGIKNTEKRIKLNCGDEYGIKIDSKKNKFTRVTLILPTIKERGNDYV